MIALPLEHLDAGHTYVAERSGQILGFSVVLPRPALRDTLPKPAKLATADLRAIFFPLEPQFESLVPWSFKDKIAEVVRIP